MGILTGVVQCEAGTFSIDGSCVPCSAGLFANVSGSTVCTSCSLGTYTLVSGAAVCALCPPGSFCNSSIFQCPVGTYSNVSGAVSCQPCSASQYSAGFYCPAGSSAPVACAQNMAGSADGSQCVLMPGYGYGTKYLLMAPKIVTGAVYRIDLDTKQSVRVLGNGSSVCPSTTDILPGTSMSINNPSGVVVDPTGTYAIISLNYNCKMLVMYTISTGLARVVAGSETYVAGKLFAPTALCFTPDGTTAYVTDMFASKIWKFNTSDWSYTAFVPSYSMADAVVYVNKSADLFLLASGQDTGKWVVSKVSTSGAVVTVVAANILLGLPALDLSRDLSYALMTDQTGIIRKLDLGTFALTTLITATYTATPNLYGIKLDPTNTYALIADNNDIRKLTLSPVVSVGASIFTFSSGQGSYPMSLIAGSIACTAGYYSPGASNGCAPCGAGSFSNASASSACGSCLAGTYTNATGATVCNACSSACSLGYYTDGVCNSSSNLPCVICPAGSISNKTTATQCYPCIPGTEAPAAGLSACTQCVAGKYASGVGTATCISCEAGTFCVVGSSTNTACPAGRYSSAPGATVCLNCPSGSFASASAATVCTSCSSGTYCPLGSTANTACMTGSVCVTPASQVACANSSYCPAGTTASAPCATGSVCPTPSTQTPCAPTFYCPQGSTAQTLCAAGSVCATPSSQVVCAAGFACPAGSTAPIACSPGAYCQAGASVSIPCAVGRYCETPANSTACGLGYFCLQGSTAPSLCTPACSVPGTYESVGCTASTDRVCGSCSNRAGNSTYTGVGTTGANCPWVCDLGYYLNGSACLGCPANSWCGANVRNQCPLNTYSAAGSSSQNSCLCLPGYAGNGSLTGTSPCAVCTASSYCPGGNANTTLQCPGNFTSNAGASQQSQCYCLAGYQLNGTACTLCPANTYCASGVLNTCQANAASPEGSSANTSCVCVPGFHGDRVCAQCPANSYCTGGSSLSTCTAHAVSPAQSTSASACYCDRGYEGVANAPCSACLANTWCWTGVANPCPANSTSPAQSSWWLNCSCDPGHTGPDGGPCPPCAPGTYKPVGGNDACAACPAGLSCPMGSVGPAVCAAGGYCLPGVGQPTPCTQGHYCGSGVSEPVDCPIGTFAGALGMSACLACPADSYASTPGTVACVECPLNSFAPAYSNTSLACSCSAGLFMQP